MSYFKRFAQSAGPRTPLRAVRRAAATASLSPLCHGNVSVFHTLLATFLHFWANSGPRLAPFWVFGVTFGGHGEHFLPLKIKIGHPGRPSVIFPDIKSHFGSHFEVSFWIFSQKVAALQVLFSVLFHSHVFNGFLCVSWLVEP